MDIKDNVVIVTGGASGLGGATSKMVIDQGGKVLIIDMNAELGESYAKELGANARFVKGDVSSEADGQAAVEAALGDGIKAPTASEWPIRQLVRRSAFVANYLQAGHVLGPADLEYLRPGDGIGPEHAHELVGRRTRHALPAGHRLDWKDLA